MKNFFLLFSILAITIAFKCIKDKNCPKDGHNGMTIKNESNKRIRYMMYWNYPNTEIGEYNPTHDETKGILPNKSHTRGAGLGSCWESIFVNNKKEWIYIFDADTIELLDWSLIRKTERGLLERKEINLEYLKNNDFYVRFNETN